MKTTLLSMLFVALSVPALAEPLATANGDKEGVRVEVTDLKRGSGDVVTLKFTIVNDSKETIDMLRYLAEGTSNQDTRTVSGISLADPANKKKLLVIRDEEKNPLSSSKVEDIAPGTKRSLWAKFPAPSSGTVSVIIPHFEPIDDVPVR